jgi:hypothetical protein
MPATLPLLSPSGVRAYWEAIGETPEVESNDVGKGLPLFLAGRLDLERFAGGVLDAWRALPETERERTVLLTSHWVTASTFEYYARNDPHPPVVSPHNAYYFWQVDLTGRDLVMTVDIGEEILAKYFERTRALATLECEYCVDFPEALPVFISSGPKRPLPELIESWRDFGIQPVAALRGDSFLSGRPR